MDLDLKIYRLYNSDLSLFSDEQLLNHYNQYGKNENRICNVKQLLNSKKMIYFNINDYINYNPDLQFNSKTDYVLDYIEKRLDESRIINKKLYDFKLKKQSRFKNLLKVQEYNKDNELNINFLTESEKKEFKFILNHVESCNEWDEGGDISSMIDEKENPTGKNSDLSNRKLVLNIGAGYRTNTDRYYKYDNIINTEIFNYPTTDIICNGDNLPFKDNSFDAVLSLAVLEHVKEPWIHAKEMIRILKPGGKLFVDVPFLQPYHGYPYHYYNMTSAGLLNLFEKNINVISHKVEYWQKPIFSLTWFLSVYSNSLDSNTREKFDNLTVKEIIQNGNNLSLDYVNKLDSHTENILACGTSLFAQKK